MEIIIIVFVAMVILARIDFLDDNNNKSDWHGY